MKLVGTKDKGYKLVSSFPDKGKDKPKTPKPEGGEPKGNDKDDK